MNTPPDRRSPEVPLDRREFIHGAAVGIAAAALGQVSDLARDVGSPGPGRIRWGVWPDARGGKDVAEVRDALEAEIGRRFAIDRKRGSGVGLDAQLITNYVRRSAAEGRMPYLKVHSWRGSPDTGGRVPVPWADIAAGRWDGRIAALARAASSFRRPMYFTFHAEPNIQSAAQPHIGSPADFRAAWARVRGLFDLGGTPNVRWVVVLTADVYASGLAEVVQWLPDRFDVLGVDGYNNGGCTPNGWRSFEQIFSPAQTIAASRGKPMFIGECGSVEDTQCGGSDSRRKGRWFKEADATLRGWPEVEAVVWNHSHGWWVDSSSASLASFRAMSLDPYMGRSASL